MLVLSHGQTELVVVGCQYAAVVVVVGCHCATIWPEQVCPEGQQPTCALAQPQYVPLGQQLEKGIACQCVIDDAGWESCSRLTIPLRRWCCSLSVPRTGIALGWLAGGAWLRSTMMPVRRRSWPVVRVCSRRVVVLGAVRVRLASLCWACCVISSAGGHFRPRASVQPAY